MGLRSYIVCGCLLAASLAARADTVQTFDLSGNTGTTPNITVSGTITINTTTGVVVSNNLSVNEGASSEALINDVTFAGTTNSANVYGVEFGTFDSPGGSIFLDFNEPNLIGYTGGICTSSSPCSAGETSAAEFGQNFGVSLYTGSLTVPAPPPPASTPEPSSITLLGTGLIGLAGALRKRFI